MSIGPCRSWVGAGGYQYDLKLPKTMPTGTYTLRFRAAGEAGTYHADVGATIKIG